MRAIGVRAQPGEPDSILWAVVEGPREQPVLVAHDQAEAPADADEAEALVWFRKRLLHILEKYKPKTLGLRVAERTARATNKAGPKRRLRIEGVVMEAAASQGLDVHTAALPDMAALLDIEKPKAYLERKHLRGLDWGELGDNAREAVLVGVALLAAGGKDSQEGAEATP
jgi:hypothetical protein